MFCKFIDLLLTKEILLETTVIKIFKWQTGSPSANFLFVLFSQSASSLIQN